MTKIQNNYGQYFEFGDHGWNFDDLSGLLRNDALFGRQCSSALASEIVGDDRVFAPRDEVALFGLPHVRSDGAENRDQRRETARQLSTNNVPYKSEKEISPANISLTSGKRMVNESARNMDLRNIHRNASVEESKIDPSKPDLR